MSKKLDQKAIHIARQYLEFRGYTVEDASTSLAHTGYNLIVKRNTENLKIAVKASTRPWNIPDLQPTEVDAVRSLVADFLYVVCLIGKEEPKLCIIPREAIKPEHVRPKSGWRISSRFKNESTLKPFLHAI